MSPDLVSLSDAASILGVSVERVRQLVVAGDIPGQRFGNAWAVPRDALVSRRHLASSGGRPLHPVRAWLEIVSGAVDLARPGRYQRRAHVVRCEMSKADVGSLPRDVGALVGGVRGAAECGAALRVIEGGDVYLDRSAFETLGSLVAYVVDPLGPIRLRIVDDEAWDVIPAGGFAPRGAVALDLLDSADPRHWIAAEQLVDHG